MKNMKSRIGKIIGALALVTAITIGGSTPAQAAVVKQVDANCGTTGWAAITVGNYISSFSQAKINAYNLTTGAYYGTYYVPVGATKTWYTNLRKARFIISGNGFTTRSFCGY